MSNLALDSISSSRAHVTSRSSANGSRVGPGADRASNDADVSSIPPSFRTAGFPQYGWRAGFPSGAFPDRERLKTCSRHAPSDVRFAPALCAPRSHNGCLALRRAADSIAHRRRRAWYPLGACIWRAECALFLDILRGAPQSQYANVNAPFYPAYQRLFEERGQPCPCAVAVFRLVQLGPHSQGHPHDACNGIRFPTSLWTWPISCA
jgi:hypothetical protein